ncbi:MAG: hypothetical protein K2N85_12645 [Lachnospiraceae bacterium]|nr:hypothetical protein [Lachnospiraceae bacterium]
MVTLITIYDETEFTYKMVEKTFARHVMAESEDNREKENLELREAILKLRK